MTSNTSRSKHKRPVSGSVTRVSLQKSSSDRMSIYLDGHYAFSMSAQSLSEQAVKTGDHLSSADVERLKKADEPDRAINAALYLLAHRGRSEDELRQRLRLKAYEQPAIDAAIAKVTEWGYLNDEQFASSWVEQRSLGRPRSRRVLAWELVQKGVDRSIIESAIEEADIDETEDARKLAADKWRKDRNQPLEKRRQRTASFLARRGYSWQIARQVIDELISEDADTESGPVQSPSG